MSDASSSYPYSFLRVWERLFREYERNKTHAVYVDNLKPYTQYAVYVDVYYVDAVKNASRSPIQYFTTKPDSKCPLCLALCLGVVVVHHPIVTLH